MSIFTSSVITFTSSDIDNYCLDQYSRCLQFIITLYDKLCILAIYRSPLGNLNTFLTNFDLILHKFFNLKFNFIICRDINVNYFAKSYKKNQLNNSLQSFNPSSIVNFPTRIGPNSFSTIDKFFIDNSHLLAHSMEQSPS